MKWPQDGDECIRNALDQVRGAIPAWFQLHTATRELKLGESVRDEVVNKLRDELNVRLRNRDCPYYRDGGDVTRSALSDARRLVLKLTFGRKPLQPLLVEFSREAGTDYRILVWCYEDGKSLREIGLMPEVREPLKHPGLASPHFIPEVRERVRVAYEHWQQFLRGRLKLAKSDKPVFPPPEQLT